MKNAVTVLLVISFVLLLTIAGFSVMADDYEVEVCRKACYPAVSSRVYGECVCAHEGGVWMPPLPKEKP